MSLTNTKPLEDAANNVIIAEINYVNALTVREPNVNPSPAMLLADLNAAQAAYEIEVIARTPGAFVSP